MWNGQKKSRKLPKEFFKTYVMGVWHEHDEASCTAWKAYDSLPNPKFRDMVRIAEEYGTTIQNMREHSRCE